jgi:hypothetical protein
VEQNGKTVVFWGELTLPAMSCGGGLACTAAARLGTAARATGCATSSSLLLLYNSLGVYYMKSS